MTRCSPGYANTLLHLTAGRFHGGPVQVLGADVAKGRRVMVFCNTLGSCRATEHYLREKDIHTCCYHGDVPLDGRREAIQEFTGDTGMNGQPVLVCTDLAARCVLLLEPCWLAPPCRASRCTCDVHPSRSLSCVVCRLPAMRKCHRLLALVTLQRTELISFSYAP